MKRGDIRLLRAGGEGACAKGIRCFGSRTIQNGRGGDGGGRVNGRGRSEGGRYG